MTHDGPIVALRLVEPSYEGLGKGLVRATGLYLELRAAGTTAAWIADYCLDYERLFSQLSPVTQIVLICTASGLTQREIAELMGCSLRTCRQIFVVLGIRPLQKMGPGIGRPPKRSHG